MANYIENAIKNLNKELAQLNEKMSTYETQIKEINYLMDRVKDQRDFVNTQIETLKAKLAKDGTE